MLKFYPKLLVVLCIFCSCTALYEDQVGKFDWKQSYVGKVIHSYVDYATESVLVATEENVVASINALDGSLQWRKVLENGVYGKILAFSVGNEVTTVSGNGPYLLRGWIKKSGILAYEWVIPSLGNRDTKWTVDSGKVYQVRFLGSEIEYTVHHVETGIHVRTDKVQAPRKVHSETCILDKAVVLCIERDSSTLVTFSLSNNSWQIHEKIGPSDKTYIALNPLPSTAENSYPEVSSAVLRTSDGEQIAITVFENNVLYTGIPVGSTAAVIVLNKAPVFIRISNNDGGFDTGEIIDGKYHPLGSTVTHSQKLANGVISSVACLAKKMNGCLFVIVGDDDSLTLMMSDRLIWVREEALANVITVEMLDLPVSDEEAAIEKEFANKEVGIGLTSGILGMFYRRVHSQCLQAINFVTGILGLKESKGESRTDLVKDPFGLHKLIIIVTKASKVYGIENDKGDIVWQFHLKDLSPFNLLGELGVPLFIQRTSRHLPHPPICNLIFKQKNTGLSALYSFNPINGHPLYDGLTLLDYKVKQSLLLPQEDKEFIKGLLLLSEKDEVYFWPESAKEIALSLRQSLFLFTVNPETGVLEGYTFVSPNNQDLTALFVWNVRLSPPIIKVAIKNKAERVHSQGRVLGDRSVLYKYINPHLIAVATHTADPVHKNLITIFLIDTVGGAVVFSVVHKRAVPPVHIVHSENWIVYSFFNDKSRRTEVISLDLYEGKSQRNTTEFTSLSFALDPLIERQAYIFPHNVMAMRETITEKGITNKHVLVGVSTGSVIEVPWALLDPHRSPDGREEGVLPYTPDLSLPPEAFITYNHSLPQITGIHTSPSGLESTSLVLIYGLDLFYTRVAPSKTFDVLKDDFEYWLITLVLGGLITAAYVSKRLASRKALRQAWK